MPRRPVRTYRIGYDNVGPDYEVRVYHDPHNGLHDAEIGYVGSPAKDAIHMVSMYIRYNLNCWILENTVFGSSVFTITDVESGRAFVVNKKQYQTDMADDNDLELTYFVITTKQGAYLITRPSAHEITALKDLADWVF
jgi:hypothetical protein